MNRWVALLLMELLHSLDSVPKDPIHCPVLSAPAAVPLVPTQLEFCCSGACHTSQKNKCRPLQSEQLSKYRPHHQEKLVQTKQARKIDRRTQAETPCSTRDEISARASNRRPTSDPHPLIQCSQSPLPSSSLQPSPNLGWDSLLHQRPSSLPEVQNLWTPWIGTPY